MQWKTPVDETGRLWNVPLCHEFASKEVVVTVEEVVTTQPPVSPGRLMWQLAGIADELWGRGSEEMRGAVPVATNPLCRRPKMKSARDWLTDEIGYPDDDCGMRTSTREQLEAVLEKVQKDAWNAAIDAAASLDVYSRTHDAILLLKKE